MYVPKTFKDIILNILPYLFVFFIAFEVGATAAKARKKKVLHKEQLMNECLKSNPDYYCEPLLKDM